METITRSTESNMEVMPIIRPTLPTFREFEELVRPGWEDGLVTTGPIVRAFEQEVCRRTGATQAIRCERPYIVA